MSEAFCHFTMMKIDNVEDSGFYYIQVEYNKKKGDSERRFNGRQLRRLYSLPSRNCFSIPLDMSLQNQYVKISLCEERRDFSILSTKNTYQAVIGKCEICLDNLYRDFLYDGHVNLTHDIVFQIRYRLENFGRYDLDKKYPFHRLFSPLFPGFVVILNEILLFLDIYSLIRCVGAVSHHLHKRSKSLPLRNVNFRRSVKFGNLVKDIRKVKIYSLKVSELRSSHYMRNEKAKKRNRILKSLRIVSSDFGFYDIQVLLNYFIKLKNLEINLTRRISSSNYFDIEKFPLLRFRFPSLNNIRIISSLNFNQNFFEYLLKNCKNLSQMRFCIRDDSVITPEIIEFSNEKIEGYYPDMNKWSELIIFNDVSSLPTTEIVYYHGILLGFRFLRSTDENRNLVDLQIRCQNTNLAINFSISIEIKKNGKSIARKTYRDQWIGIIDSKFSKFEVWGETNRNPIRGTMSIVRSNQIIVRLKINKFVTLGEYASKLTDDYIGNLISQLLPMDCNINNESTTTKIEEEKKPENVVINRLISTNVNNFSNIQNNLLFSMSKEYKGEVREIMLLMEWKDCDFYPPDIKSISQNFRFFPSAVEEFPCFKIEIKSSSNNNKKRFEVIIQFNNNNNEKGKYKIIGGVKISINSENGDHLKSWKVEKIALGKLTFSSDSPISTGNVFEVIIQFKPTTIEKIIH